MSEGGGHGVWDFDTFLGKCEDGLRYDGDVDG